MKLPLLSFLLLLFICNSGFSQTITLRHIKRDKIKVLDSNDDLIFVTEDTTYKHHKLVNIENDHILITAIGTDTLSIAISNLLEIKKFNFRKRGILDVIVPIGLLSAAGIGVFPVASLIDSDLGNPLGVALTLTTVTALSGGIFWIVISKRKFQLSEWQIVNQ